MFGRIPLKFAVPEMIIHIKDVFGNIIKAASTHLRLKEFHNAEALYKMLLADIYAHSYDEVGLNDLDMFSIQCCLAYSSLAVNSKSEQAIRILESLKSIKLPLVPYLKTRYYLATGNLNAAELALKACNQLFDDGYNFRPNVILNADIIQEINEDFIKSRLNVLTSTCIQLKIVKPSNPCINFLDNGVDIQFNVEDDMHFQILDTTDHDALPKVSTNKPPGSNPSKLVSVGTQTPKLKKVDDVSSKASSAALDTNVELIDAIKDIQNKVHNLQSNKGNEIKKLEVKLSENQQQLLAKEKKILELNQLKSEHNRMSTKLVANEKKILELNQLMCQLSMKYEAAQKQIIELLQKSKEVEVQSFEVKLAQQRHDNENKIIQLNRELNHFKNEHNRMSMKYEAAKKKIESLQKSKEVEVKSFELQLSQKKNQLVVNEMRIAENHRKLEEQLQHKCTIQRVIYSMLVYKCQSKIAYFSEIKPFLSNNTNLTTNECNDVAAMWRRVLDKFITEQQKLDKYQDDLHEILSDPNQVRNITLRDWPDIPQVPIQDVIYAKFKQILYNHAMRNEEVTTSLMLSPFPPPEVSASEELIVLPVDAEQPTRPTDSSTSSLVLPTLPSYESASKELPLTSINLPLLHIEQPTGPSGSSSSSVVLTTFPPEESASEELPLTSIDLPLHVEQPTRPSNTGSSTSMSFALEDRNNSWPLLPAMNNPIPSTSTSNTGTARCFGDDEDLYYFLRGSFPGVHENTWLNVFLDVRDNYGTTVNGIPRDQIVEEMRQILSNAIQEPKGVKKKKRSFAPFILNTLHNESSETSNFSFTEEFRMPDVSQNDCVICFEHLDFNKKCSMLKCQHEFHTKCIKTWLKQGSHCPICRSPVVKGQEFVLEY